MPLVIVNPSKNPAAPKARRKARTRKGATMATRKRRSPAQRRAFARMISRNPYHRRRRRRNPPVTVLANPRRRRVSRRVVHHNPIRRYAHRRRHRNPSEGVIGSLMSMQGLMGIAAVVGTPTLMTYGMSALFPSTTGIYNAAGQAVIGVAAAYVVGKFLDKQTGTIVGMVALGTALASAIADIQAGTPNVMAGPAMPTRRLGTRTLGTRTNAQGYITMSGYIPSSGNNDGNMNGYATMMGVRKAPRMGAAPREPGVYYF